MNTMMPKKDSKIHFHEKKENTIRSLFEVENFLCNFKTACKFFKFFKLFKP